MMLLLTLAVLLGGQLLLNWNARRSGGAARRPAWPGSSRRTPRAERPAVGRGRDPDPALAPI